MQGIVQSKIIPLNIVMTYPVYWNRYKIFRDFIQNFYDSVGFEDWQERFRYQYDNNKLEMWVDDEVFSYEWLLHIGASTKTISGKNAAGYFGEGFKIASLCAFRDYGWEIEMTSGDWDLTVTTLDQTIEDQDVKVLAYDVKVKEYQKRSKLTLSNVLEESFELFQTAMISFYYYGNPLLGEKIWDNESAAVYFCNTEAYKEGLPYTRKFGRRGAVFCAYQLLASNPFGLVVCLHDYNQNNRDRRELYAFDVVQIFGTISMYLLPDAAMCVLEKMRRFWNAGLPERIEVDSWCPVIYSLICRICLSDDAVYMFRDKYPNLLCLKTIHNIYEKNRRTQARAWLRAQEKEYLLVQGGFTNLGYPVLEDLCEEMGGFVEDSAPSKLENQCFQIIEDTVRAIYGTFFYFDNGYPSRRIIVNDRASYHGMALTF